MSIRDISNTISKRIPALVTRSQIEGLKKELRKATIIGKSRIGLGKQDAQTIRHPLSIFGIAFFLEGEVSIFSDIVQTLRQEIFRNGFEWTPKFALKCPSCNTEYETKVDECEECGSTVLLPPNKIQQDYFTHPDGTSFFEKANENNQSLLEVCMDVESNLDIADNGYMLISQSYITDDEGEIKASFPHEILSVDPRDLVKVFDEKTGYLGNKYTCLNHRDQFAEDPDRTCPKCGLKMHPIHFETVDISRVGAEQMSFLEREVCHSPKYHPALIYGFPTVLKMVDDAWAYYHIEKRVRSYYERGRVSGLLTFPTKNPSAFEIEWKKTNIAMKQDPYYIPAIPYDSEGRSPAQFLKLMEDPNPAMLEVKKEIMERFGSRFNVSLIFMADTSTSGGLNNEGLQITVTNRGVEFGQKLWNDKYLPFLCRTFGITDWDLKLKPSEERDEMADKQRFQMDIQNAQGMLQLGYVPEFIEDEFGSKEFTYEYDPKKAKEILGQGMGMEGMGGGFPAPDQGMTGEPFALSKSSLAYWEQVKEGKKKDLETFDPESYMNRRSPLLKDFLADVFDAIRKGAMYEHYAGFSEKEIDSVHSIVRDAFETHAVSYREMAKDMMARIPWLSEGRAEMIARTEATAVTNKANELRWKALEEQTGKTYKFKVIIMRDHRTSDVSKEIYAKVQSEGGAVSMERLKQIYKEVSQKHWTGKGQWSGWEQFMGHPHERDIIQRVI